MTLGGTLNNGLAILHGKGVSGYRKLPETSSFFTIGYLSGLLSSHLTLPTTGRIDKRRLRRRAGSVLLHGESCFRLIPGEKSPGVAKSVASLVLKYQKPKDLTHKGRENAQGSRTNRMVVTLSVMA